MKTIDEQLEDALARVKQLEADAQAGTNFLNEAAKTSHDLREQVAALTSEKAALTQEKETLTLANTELTEQRDQLASDLATAKQSLTSAATTAEELTKAKEQIIALTAEVEKLKAEAKTAERIAAERYGAASPKPLPVTSRGDAKATELVAKFKAITDPKEQTKFNYSICAWMLSQFLHGEQGALFAAAQVTEAVQFFDGKLYGSTQVMDEGRHVEVFSRYLNEKLNRLYQINDNLFVIVDALMTDGRWDMKFLGMQIMVEGLALGAFGTLYRTTKEPLLRELLKRVILDEARHVHYGVVALKEHIKKDLSEAERHEREDWAFEIALLMKNRFMAYEVYDEWFADGRISREQWRRVVNRSKGMIEFRHVMFSRLVPNLREIGLLSPRIMPAYERIGLLPFMQGKAAPELSGEQLVADLDRDLALRSERPIGASRHAS